MNEKDKMKVVSLNADVVEIPVGDGTHETSEEELNKHIDELFDKYICIGMGIKPEDELYAKLRVIRKIFNNGYRCGYNDMLSRLKLILRDAADGDIRGY